MKDLDIYCFYSAAPGVPRPYSRHGKADFGNSEFDHHFDHHVDQQGHRFRYDDRQFEGRGEDLLGRALPVQPAADPVGAVRDWLGTRNSTPRLLRQKGIVGLYPDNFRGQVIWDPETDLEEWPR